MVKFGNASFEVTPAGIAKRKARHSSAESRQVCTEGKRIHAFRPGIVYQQRAASPEAIPTASLFQGQLHAVIVGVDVRGLLPDLAETSKRPAQICGQSASRSKHGGVQVYVLQDMTSMR